MIKRCRDIFKFIDFLDDTRQIVPLKDPRKQPAKYILKSMFFKMKADYMRHIYECLSGDDGLLKYDTRPGRSFRDILALRMHNEIS